MMIFVEVQSHFLKFLFYYSGNTATDGQAISFVPLLSWSELLCRCQHYFAYRLWISTSNRYCVDKMEQIICNIRIS